MATTEQILAEISSTILDVHSSSAWPSRDLSNFAPWKFVLDGVACGSMEGFVQGLKFEDPAEQAAVCAMVGYPAKRRGANRNAAWQSNHTVWWLGQPVDRFSPGYQRLLDRAYAAMTMANPGFGRALLATGELKLTHRIGSVDPRFTVMTQEEFCSRLTRIRGWLRRREAENRPLHGLETQASPERTAAPSPAV